MLLGLTGLLLAAEAVSAPPVRAGMAKAIAAQAEMPLFAYTRADATPGHTTTIHIDAARHAAAPIDRNIFGNFIEHLGGVVYPGLWAQTLLNPNLERIEPGDPEPQAWHMEGATWQEGGWQSPHCVRLPGNSTLMQDLFLPVHRTRDFVLTFAARCVAPSDDGSLTFTIQGIGDKQAESYLQRAEAITGAEWRMHRLTLTLPTGRIAKGERLRFLVQHAGNEAVEIDQIEIFPVDSVEGMDPDVLRKAREWHMPLVRWPGGNFASGYHWQDGIGKPEQRPTRRNAAWGGIEPNSFGTDEFLKFCRLLKVEPQLTVNAGDGAPDEAANWVRYCNAPATTDAWGKQRAANGHPAPYDVRLWEVGNELYGPWQIGHTNAADNAARYVRFRDALLQADPKLHLIATGKGDEFTPEGLQRNADWNRRLLEAAVAEKRPAPDYLALHPLVPLPGDLAGVSYADQYASAMAHPTFLDRELFPSLARLIASVPGAKGKTRLAITEWGLIVGGAKWRESPNHDAQAGVVYNALALNAMLRHSDLVTLGNMTAFMHGGGIKKPAGVVIVDPQYWTQQIYAASGIHAPVAVTATGPGQDVPARGFLPAVADVPDIDVFAALTADAQSLVVFAVNRHLTDARPISLTIAGFSSASLTAVLLTAPDPQTRNTLSHFDAVAPHPFAVPPWPAPPGSVWQTTLPPHSLAVFTLHRRN
jgi:alpha-N-arabinofuranosidase